MMNSEDEYLEPEQKPEAQLFLPLMGSDIKVLVRMTVVILQYQGLGTKYQGEWKKRKEFDDTAESDTQQLLKPLSDSLCFFSCV